MILPGLAFDPLRRRLGHGRGYYDRYINTYCLDYPRRFNHKPPPRMSCVPGSPSPSSPSCSLCPQTRLATHSHTSLSRSRCVPLPRPEFNGAQLPSR